MQYRKINGSLVKKTAEEWAKYDYEQKTLDEVLNEVRAERNRLLSASDVMMFEDFPVSTSKERVLAYRQELRDFPNTIKTKPSSIEDIVYPKL